MQQKNNINPIKLLNSIIENGKQIVNSGIQNESTYKAWYQHAESALNKTFGEDWRSFVFWEGYKYESSYENDLKRLAISVSYIENALPVFGDNVPELGSGAVNPKALLESLIKNARQIINLNIKNEGTYKAWYQYAESALNKTFGEDWRSFVFWEGYKYESSYENDLKRLAISVSYIERGVALVSQANENKPKEESNETVNKKVPVEKQDLRIFIVHGHDDVAKLELKNYLQNTLKLSEPIILHEQPNHGRAIIEKFEKYANESTFSFVLLTPDDTIAKESSSESKVYRARQNVIFELGFFLGIFGRKSGRVVLLYKGELDIPSDISGVVYIDITHGIESAGEKIRRELTGFL